METRWLDQAVRFNRGLRRYWVQIRRLHMVDPTGTISPGMARQRTSDGV